MYVYIYVCYLSAEFIACICAVIHLCTLYESPFAVSPLTNINIDFSSITSVCGKIGGGPMLCSVWFDKLNQNNSFGRNVRRVVLGPWETMLALAACAANIAVPQQLQSAHIVRKGHWTGPVLLLGAGFHCLTMWGNKAEGDFLVCWQLRRKPHKCGNDKNACKHVVKAYAINCNGVHLVLQLPLPLFFFPLLLCLALAAALRQ